MGERLKIKEDYRIHTVLLSVLFVLGNAIITFPKSGANNNTFLGFLVAFIIALCLAVPVSGIINRLLNCKIKSVLYICNIALIGFILYDAGRCVKDYVGFVSRSILPETSIFVIGAVLFLVTLWSATRPSSTILKFSLISFFIVSVVVILFFIFSMKSLNIEYIFLLSLPDFYDVIKQSLPYISGVFLSFITTFIYQKQILGSVKNGGSVISVLLTGLLFGVVLLNSILLFGSRLSGDYKYPYSDAISVISIGDLFTRMDGFAYFVFFATSLIKLTVSVFVTVNLLGSVGIKNKKITAASATVIIFILSLIFR